MPYLAYVVKKDSRAASPDWVSVTIGMPATAVEPFPRADETFSETALNQVKYGFRFRGFRAGFRLARLVIPGLPHHITQRGNRRQQTFFNDGDYAVYLELMADWCREQGVGEVETGSRNRGEVETGTQLVYHDRRHHVRKIPGVEDSRATNR